jgi:hypothetical protein
MRTNEFLITAMNERTKTGLEILQVAVGLGVLGDVLLRQTPWGLNVLMFNLAFAAGLLLLLRRHAPERLTGQTYPLLGALVFFASMFVWRDAIELRVADTFAIIAILGVLFLPTLKISAKVGGLFQYAVGVVWAALNAVFASWALLGRGYTMEPASCNRRATARIRRPSRRGDSAAAAFDLWRPIHGGGRRLRGLDQVGR